MVKLTMIMKFLQFCELIYPYFVYFTSFLMLILLDKIVF